MEYLPTFYHKFAPNVGKYMYGYVRKIIMQTWQSHGASGMHTKKQHIQINLGSTSKHTGYNIHIPQKKIQVV